MFNAFYVIQKYTLNLTQMFSEQTKEQNSGEKRLSDKSQCHQVCVLSIMGACFSGIMTSLTQY